MLLDDLSKQWMYEYAQAAHRKLALGKLVTKSNKNQHNQQKRRSGFVDFLLTSVN